MKLFMNSGWAKLPLGGWGFLLLVILLTSCRKKREVHTTFYFWKTIYQLNKAENDALTKFECRDLYLRIMDVDLDIYQKAMPVAPISFKQKMKKGVNVIPVIFIVNNALKNQSDEQLEQLAHNILAFVKNKLLEAGKNDYNEIQIDCDWTQGTREKYFFLLKKIKIFNANRSLSVTLRLHQLKNRVKSGIPPADRVMLMMYNMGNLRQFGNQNSIIDVKELKRYANNNLASYPLKMDIALPLFSWSVVFSGGRYAGLSKKLTVEKLKNETLFEFQSDGLFRAKQEMPQFGIKQNDLIRYEESRVQDLKATADYLSSYLSEKPINLVYYHLDQQLFSTHPTYELDEIAHLLR